MDRCGVTCLIVLVAVTVAIAKKDSNEGIVEIHGMKVTLKCPWKNGIWWQGEKNVSNSHIYTIDQYTGQHNGLYTCRDKINSSRFIYTYTNLKVCEGCMELDVMMGMGIVLGDVLMSLGVIVIAYYCAKNKATPAPAAPQRAQRRQPTPGTSSDTTYQELIAGTRSTEVYSDVKKK